MEIVLVYFLIINVIGYSLMGIDKKRAVRGAWRISEASLFTVAFLGGALGCTLGMNHFRHKTKHLSAAVSVPTDITAPFRLRLLPPLRPKFLFSVLRCHDHSSVAGIHTADSSGIHDDTFFEFTFG